MTRHQISVSPQSIAAFDAIVADLGKAFDDGVLPWQPSQAKTLEMLCWVYRQLCEKKTLDVGATLLFRPVTARQGRPVFAPTLHQVSVASKMLIEKLGRTPTEREVNMFLKRNPDIGWRKEDQL